MSEYEPLSLELNVQDMARINNVFKDMAGLGNDADFWDVIGLTGLGRLQDRIDQDKGSPDGTPWLPLSDEYAAYKSKVKPNSGMFVFSGDFRDSLENYDHSSEGVVWGSSYQPARWLHEGTERNGKQSMPARPWLGFDNDDIDEMVIEGINFIEGLVNNNG